MVWLRKAGVLLLLLGMLGQPAPARAAGVDTAAWAGAYAGVAPGLRYSRTTWTATELNDGLTAIDGSSPRDYEIAQLRIAGFAGFSWRHERWVFGPELDFAWADERETRAFFPGCSLGCSGFTPPPGPNDTTSVRMKWDGGVRGRLGYLVKPTLLLYGTGGFAMQEVETEGVCHNPTLDSQYCFGPLPISPIRHDQLFLGFAVGGGVETMLSEHWFLRAEYRFAYFPGMDDTLAFPPGGTGPNTYRYAISAQTHTLTMGIAYGF